MSYQMERAWLDMGADGAVFYGIKYRTNKPIDPRVLSAFELVQPEFIQWVSAGSPGLARCFECPRSSQCNGGEFCCFPF